MNPLITFKVFVAPTPTKFTLIISFPILSKDLPSIEEGSSTLITVVPIPTPVDNPTGRIFLAIGLCIILSILIILLFVAASVSTARVWLVPTPATFTKVTPKPLAALDVLIATLILSLVSLIGYTFNGRILVLPIPATLVVTIPIAVLPTPE